MKNTAKLQGRNLMITVFLNLILIVALHAQSNCISTVATACLGECHAVTYVGNASPNANYQWSISCGTITNPTQQNPHTACFLTPGICTIQLIVQEPGLPPDTCVVEVNVFPVPQGDLTLSRDSICLGDCVILQLNLKGTPPFSFQIKANNVVNNYTSDSANVSLIVCPRFNTTFSLVSLSDKNCSNPNPNTEDSVVVLPPFIGSVSQVNNMLCASPSNVIYAWYACNSSTLLSTAACYAPTQNGCYCVILDNGVCKDTVCTNFSCNLSCSFDFPDTILVGDTALIHYTGNGGPNTIFNWTLNVDQLIGLHFFGQDSLMIKYNLPGCYPINLNVREANCGNSCSDTICVISKPCNCDTFTKNKITPIASSGSSCCYDVTGKVASFNCFTAMQILLSSGSFVNVQADAGAGWSVSNSGVQQIQFTHNSGHIPPGVFHAGSFCVSNSTNYIITVRYLYAGAGISDTCTFQYVFNCPQPPIPPKCDSLVSFLEKQHTIPGFCCYNLHTDNPYSNQYNQIKVTLSSGNFSGVTANSGQGYFLVSGGLQEFTLAHNSGFIPTGQTLPGSFCINGAVNPITVTVKYYYPVPGGKDSCSFQFIFDCPGFSNPPSCCDSTTLKLVPFGTQPNCCYEVQGNSVKSKCFSQICFKTSSGNFTNIIANSGWTTSITPQGICFLPNGLFFPTGPINPGSFCITGAVNPFTITANYYDTNGMILDSCKKTFVENCPPPPKACNCDSLTNKVNSLSTMPGLCCYGIQGSVPVSNCFTQIGVQLSSGAFTNVVPGSGWNAFSNGLQNLTLINNSGFIPSGIINPATFCVTGATTYTITVNYFFTNNGVKDTCKFKYTFDCPNPPKPCNCDSLTNAVNQTSVVPGLCCYNLQGNVPTANCFTSIQVLLSSGSFTNIQNGSGWSHTSGSLQNFTLNHNSGFVPSGIINPASFCVTGSTVYTITVFYFYTNNGVKDTCKFKYTFDCPNAPKPCSCDSLQSFVNQTSVTPGLCCYDLEGQVPTANCFSQIHVYLNSGSFSNVQNGIGWTHTTNNAQFFTLNHSSGFVPAGIITPASFCVTGSTFYTITVNYIYTKNNGLKDSCSFKYTFDCPNVPKSCSCDSLQNFVNQTSVTPGLCCYDLEGEVPKSNCFTQIHVFLNSGSFSNIQNGIGWNHTSNSAQYFTLNHNSGFVPAGTIAPASFCVTGSTFYMITVNYIYTKSNGLKDSCTFKYTFDCPNISKPCNCDSLKNIVNQTSAIPGLCCHNIQGNVPVGNCFTSMQVLLSSGNFTNIVPGNGWTIISNNAQSFNINPNTNFIPTGMINPVAFCVTGSTLYSITVYYFYTNNGVKDTCKFKYNFDCPSKTDSLCDQSNCASGNKAWQVIANGVSFVYDMVVYQCKLIVAGQFTQIGNTTVNNIAAWDGTGWTALGQGVNGPVRALAVHNGILYAGGQFNTAGTTTNVNNIAAWNGTNWSHLDNGVTGNGTVFIGSLLSTSSGLVAAGSFQNAGLTSSLATNNIAQWNGTSWNNNFNTLSAVFNGPIYTLREFNGNLYAAGTFNSPYLNTARWNGSSWLNNGTGINLVNNVPYNGVAAQYVYNGNLIVGGHFLNANSLPMTQHIAVWNGNNWSAIPGGDLPDTINAVHDFIKYNNKLYAGGAINQMGSTLLNGVGEWNGNNWSGTNHPPQIIWALEAYDSCGRLACDLYSGGEGFVNRWICLTSNRDLNKKSNFTVQPNPVDDILYVNFENGQMDSRASLRILNVQGKEIFVLKNIHEEKTGVDVSHLTSGIYVIEYSDGNNAPSQQLFLKI